MSARKLRVIAAAGYLLVSSSALAADTTDDRIALSADGSTLTGTNGGEGGSLGWLHNFDANTLAGLAVEHQKLATAQWTFGSINGALTTGPDNERFSFYGDAHEGAGDDAGHPFNYSIEGAGVIGTFYHRLSAQIEDRRIDVETTHGNLPKVGLSYLWGPHLMTSVSYCYTVSGNLGTRLTAVRVDGYGSKVNLLGGVAFGPAAPAILNIQSEIIVPGRQLREGYVGMSKTLPRLRSDVTLVADYLDLAGIKRASLTLNYIFHVGGTGTAR